MNFLSAFKFKFAPIGSYLQHIFSIFFPVFLLPVFCISVFASSVENGTPTSAGVSYLTGVVDGLSPNQDYFLYKSGDYTVTLLYGYDFVFENQVVSGSDATMMVYNTREQADGYNYTPSVTSSSVSSFQVATNKYSIVYSNLGSFARLRDQTSDLLSYILYSLIFFLLVFLVIKLFRFRRHYIQL